MLNLPIYRIGEGHDLHRTITGRPLILGGIKVAAPFGLDGHSDADVLIHAVIDGLLGAAGRGDIGERFPNTDDQWKNADSGNLLRLVRAELVEEGWRIENLDCTITAEHPQLTPWKSKIRNRLCELLQVTAERVNVKAKSGERVGPVGRGEAIAADAAVLLSRDSPKLPEERTTGTTPET